MAEVVELGGDSSSSGLEVVPGAAAPIEGPRVFAAAEISRDAPLTPPEFIPDHCAAALDRLAAQFKQKTQWETFICVFASRWDQLEQDLANILAFRSLETAYGVQLDRLGENLDEKRRGLSDDAYRALLRAKTKVIGSVGTSDELLEVLTLLDNGFQPSQISLREDAILSVVMTVLVPAAQLTLGYLFADFLRQVKGGGVKLVLQFHELGVTQLSWALNAPAGDPSPPAGSGWAEFVGGAGGKWSEAV
jgi:hypothetical protein